MWPPDFQYQEPHWQGCIVSRTIKHSDKLQTFNMHNILTVYVKILTTMN